MTTSVWSATDAAANGMTLTNGGLTVTPSGAGNNQALRGTVSHNTGKWYVEFLNSASGANANMMLGLADSTFNAVNQYLGSNGISVGLQLAGAAYQTSGFSAIAPSAFSPQLNDVLAIAVDFDAGKAWLARNNTWLLGLIFQGDPLPVERSPSSGTLQFITMTAAPALGATLFPAMTFIGASQGVWTLQATAGSQKYAPPAGFSAWDPPVVVSVAQARAMVLA